VADEYKMPPHRQCFNVSGNMAILLTYKRKMKKIILVTSLFFVTNQCFSQSTAARDRIKTLLEVTGSGTIGIQVMENMINSFKKSMPKVPSTFWDDFMKEVNSATLIELIIPIYAKHYTDAEIIQLLEFYQTPLGKKVIEKLPLISQESYVVGSEWGKQISEQVVKRLMEKSYIENN
jgi:hypothetical protein